MSSTIPQIRQYKRPAASPKQGHAAIKRLTRPALFGGWLYCGSIDDHTARSITSYMQAIGARYVECSAGDQWVTEALSVYIPHEPGDTASIIID